MDGVDQVGVERVGPAACGSFSDSVGLAAMVRLYQVSPFDFSGSAFEWIRVVQVLLFVGIAGAIIGIIVAIVSLVRSAMDASRD